MREVMCVHLQSASIQLWISSSCTSSRIFAAAYNGCSEGLPDGAVVAAELLSDTGYT